MNALAQAIQSQNLTGTPGEIAKAFDADVSLSMDSTSYSLSGLAAGLAAQGVSPLILIDLRAHVRTLPIGGDTLEGLLLTGGGAAGGVDFSLAAIRYQIEANIQHPQTTAAQQSILAGMLLIGVKPGKQWQLSGLDALPDENAVAAAGDQVAVHDWTFAAIAMLQTGLQEGKSIDELKAMIAGA